MNIKDFNCRNSSIGSPGNGPLPKGVHFRRTSSPKKASLASFCANVPAFPPVLSFAYRCRTPSTHVNLSFGMADEDRSLPGAVGTIGSGSGIDIDGDGGTVFWSEGGVIGGTEFWVAFRGSAV